MRLVLFAGARDGSAWFGAWLAMFGAGRVCCHKAQALLVCLVTCASCRSA